MLEPVGYFRSSCPSEFQDRVALGPTEAQAVSNRPIRTKLSDTLFDVTGDGVDIREGILLSASFPSHRSERRPKGM